MDSSNSGNAARPLSSSLASFSSSGVTGAAASGQRHAFRRLQSRQQFFPLLLITTALTLLIVIATGYVAARANAISAAEASARANAQVAREVIGERGQFPALANGQLVASTGADTYPLVGDTWVVDRVRQLTSEWAVIYQLDDSGAPTLRAVATDLPKIDSQGHPVADSRATGQPMPAAAQSALVGSCGAVTVSAACYGAYSGEVTIAGVSYVAAFEPLLDQNGSLVGAVGVLVSLDDVLAAPKQLAIMLLSLGMLVGLVALVLGTWIAGQFPNRLLRQLDGQLDTMTRAAVELGRLAHQQQYRLQRQQRAARQVGEYAVQLEALATTMDDGHSALRRTTTAIWEEMSQPGVAINAATALRLAREAAVRASEIGTAGDETRAHARQVIALMNQVIAEGRALAQEGQEAESHATALASTLDHMENDLGEQLVPRRHDLGSAPLIRRLSGASHRLRELLHAPESGQGGSRQQPSGRPSARAGGDPGDPGRARGLPAHGDSGRYPSATFRRAGPLSGFPRRGDRGDRGDQGIWPPASPDISGSRNGSHGGHGGGRSAGDAPSPPGGLPPLGQFNDDIPPRGPNDSHWLND